MFKIQGVVVLYNQEELVLENIKSYIYDLERLYVVDNSETKKIELIEKIKSLSSNIIYIDNNGNQGIAHALNIGARLAIEDGAAWIFTMDQDSRFMNGSLDVLIGWIKNNDTVKLGILSPFHLVNHMDYTKSDKVVDVLSVMTSGNILNLEVYKIVGPFDERYFIDQVDNEYCLRLRKNGFLVKVHYGSILIHRLGNPTLKIILGKKKLSINHNHIRMYYITRNRFYTIKKYFFTSPKFAFSEFKTIILEWIKIILFDEDKKLKSKFIVLGFYHFLIGRHGKLYKS